MSRKKKPTSDTSQTRFEDHASDARTGLLAEFWYFFRTNKKWWMIPTVVVLLLLSGVVMLGGTALAPFIYTLF